MKKSLGVLALVCGVCIAEVSNAEDGAYIEFGATVFDVREAMPEVALASPLGTLAVGWQFKYGWVAEITHTSSIVDQEQGTGINGIYIGKRMYFNGGE